MIDIIDKYKEYISEVNSIKNQKKKLNLKIKELDSKFLESLGYKHGDLLKFTDETNTNKHICTQNWTFYLIGVAIENEKIKLVCSFNPPKTKNLSKGGMWLDIDEVEKVEKNQ